MCTSVTYVTKDSYFGRNLDLEYTYDTNIVITPKNFQINFRKADTLKAHHAIIGMAVISGGYPLYFDAVNEAGLAMAGLNFPGNAVYNPPKNGMLNIAPFELIPYILGRCSNIREAKMLLGKINITNTDFSKELPLTPLHWMISDKKSSVTAEPITEGLKIYDNIPGVLTNNPPFPMQMFNLNNFISLSPFDPENTFSDDIELSVYSRGMGAMGMPGDLSSASRFVRAAFTKLNSVSGNSEEESISQFFHILGSVSQTKGCVRIADKYEYTVYSCCCNQTRGIYYYKTYENSRINAVYLHSENLNHTGLISYPVISKQDINRQNPIS